MTLQRTIGWLKEQIGGISSVRSAIVDSSGILVANTWSSGIVHIHLLPELPRVRHLKRILQENTRVGIGSLILVAANLVPEDGTTAAPDESLMALHALYRDRLYTFTESANGTPSIGQVHFKTFTARGDEREIWYGPTVSVRNLPCYRVWVNTPLSVKGNWLVANFGSEAFWKEPDYTIGREAFRREQRRSDRPTEFYTWSQSGWQEGGAQGFQTPSEPPVYAKRETELDRSYAIMGLSRTATGEEVKTTFRRLAREVHPDVSKLPKAEAEARFKLLLDAYNRIKLANGW